jgi:hypothetical protein
VQVLGGNVWVSYRVTDLVLEFVVTMLLPPENFARSLHRF